MLYLIGRTYFIWYYWFWYFIYNVSIIKVLTSFWSSRFPLTSIMIAKLVKWLQRQLEYFELCCTSLQPSCDQLFDDVFQYAHLGAESISLWTKLGKLKLQFTYYLEKNNYIQ